MTPKLKAKWIRALKSGKFTQAKQVFSNGGGYCCLGVLLEISGKPLSGHGTSYWNVMERMFGLAPDASRKLADLNDNGATFMEIAEHIKKNIPAVPSANDR